ncbi:MAG: aldo/keto reductase [Nitrososphaerales archaeon]|nr:aldo/keto reductase [Nitrososphaerales archaeon]
MKGKVFGRTGHVISEMGMGTYYDFPWIIKARLGSRGGADSKVEALKAGLDGGITLIDTAEVYNSEPLVEKAIAGRNREDLFIATKVMFLHLRHDALVRALERSLRRLGLSYLDLYQIHQPSPFVPIEETMGALEEMVDRGLARFVGVSNFSLKQTVVASKAMKKHRITSIQMPYHLADRRMEREILPFCRKENVALLAYYPLGHGKLVTNPKLREIGARHGKTASQVALNWLLAQENVFPIPRASNAAHVRENLGSMGWRLSDEEKDELEKFFPPPL